MTIGIFKEWLVKYFFVHKIVFKAIQIIFVIFYDLFLKITARSDWPTGDGR
jgi:hypothetical protein